MSNEFYICKGNVRYPFIFYSLWAACVMCRELGYDYIISAETGEIVAEFGN